MIRSILCLILLVGLVHISKAQSEANFIVKGHISDPDNKALIGATVVLLYPVDSVMAGYSITNTSGDFNIRKIESGNYIMQISYLGFVNLSQQVSVDGNTTLDEVHLNEDKLQLDEVKITADYIPIMLKKDTIEYSAAAFSTQINDKVEELLRQLPGIEIEEDGTIKAQGEEVKKILVDGKEFFGNDPKIATKNLPADAIDKIQVFDKLSDLAEFTGIDDGERSKTINLTLKDDHKNGMFGDVSAGYGTDQRYQGKASMNRFGEKTQFSFLGSLNNTNEQNFSIDDYIGFSGGLQGLANGGGMISLSMDELGGASSGGITSSQSAGINYNHDFSDQTFIETSYFFNGIQNDLLQSSNRENRITEGDYNSTQDQKKETGNFNHKVNYRLKHEWNNQDVTLRGNVKVNDGNVFNRASNQTFSTSGELTNDNDYLNTSEGGTFSFNTKAMFRRRLNEKGRTLVVSMSIDNQNENQAADQLSENRFFENGNLAQSIVIDQLQDQVDEVLDYGAKLTFTEPVGRRKYLSFSYAYQSNNNSFSKEFYDIDDVGNPIYNAGLSNSYRKYFDYHRGGIRYLISRENSKTTIGLEAQNSSLNGTYDNEGTRVSKDFFNILPSIRWSYDFSSSSNLQLSYITSIKEPSVTQLQPFVDNSNPLQIYIGNPDLGAEYKHSIGLNYQLFDMFNFTNLFLSINGTYTKNKITNSSTLNDEFVQVLKPVNVEKDVMLTGYASFGTPLRWMKSKIGLDVSTTYNRAIIPINGIENNSDRWMNSYDFSLENRKKKTFDIRGGVVFSHNVTKYSENRDLNQSFSQLTYYSHAKVSFLKKWTFNAKFDYQTYVGESFGESTSFPLLSASLSRNVMKFDRGQLKLYMFDILDQNQGIDRTNDFNYIEERRYNTMSRYLMFSFTYSLSKFG